MRLSAIDCLRRGLASTGANWELVIVQWLHGFALTLLLVVGSALPFVALGYDLATSGSFGGSGGLDDLDQARSDLLLRAQGRLLVLAAALFGMLVLWLVAVLLHAWVQAGTYGVLHAADRQALPGAVRGLRPFRTFAWRDFCGWAGRHGRRFFGFANLAGLLFLLWALAVPLWASATLGGAARWGERGALGIGCGGALPLGFAFLSLVLWYLVAQADLPREGARVFAAARVGLEVLGARLGAVVLFLLLFLCPFVVLAGIGLVLPAAGLLLAGQPLLRAAAEIGFTLIASLTQGLLLIALGGTLVALVRSETARGAGSRLTA